MRFVLMVCVSIASVVPARAQQNACGDSHLVTIEPDGSASRGSKNRLREAMQDGLPIRVGWILDTNGDGVPELTHWTDALFLTEFEGEVFTQIADIQRQAPQRIDARARTRDR